MKKINRYGGLDEERQQELIKIFCADIDATEAARILQLNRKTVNRYYNIFRTLIANHVERRKNLSVGTFDIEIEVVRNHPTSLNSRDSEDLRKIIDAQKTPSMVGFYERDGRFYTDFFTEQEKIQIRPMVRRNTSAVINAANHGWLKYSFIVDSGSGKSFKFNAFEGLISVERLPSRSKEFWNFIQTRLSKFNGVKRYLFLHIKESEWRWKRDTSELETDLSNIVLNR